MEISQNCLDLIKKWEGFRHEAYQDVAGIWTIGYGTIRYPNGKSVKPGDIISESEAEAYLKLHVEEFSDVVDKSVTVPVNQNQFDALVTFCYNVGPNAFVGSTLLKKLNQQDYTGAAEQFLVWNKATINGVKKPVQGLTNRRREEKALFEKVGEESTALQRGEASAQESVTWLEGYREADSDKTVIVAYKGSNIVEILTLETNNKNELIDVLEQYPNAANFVLAVPGKAVPTGERISIIERPKAQIVKTDPADIPALQTPLLKFGMGSEDDTPESVHQDIHRLQARLQELGYYQGAAEGEFGPKTDAAVKSFQADYFGEDQADGLVGPKTWEKLWGKDAAPIVVESGAGAETPGKNYLRLTKTNKKALGCFVLKLEYFKNGKRQDVLDVCSGAPGRQVFKKGPDSVPMTLQPLPEGKWYVHDLKWAGGRDNYHGRTFPVSGNGVGPVSVRLDYKGPGTTRRSAIEIHIDWNRRSAPGTAGCVGIYNIADYKRFVTWLRDTDPRDLYVDWGLGSCPQP
ncbi:MAG: glycoside hydrolase family protein [Cyanobacteria bacterium P01_H01_bin.15]